MAAGDTLQGRRIALVDTERGPRMKDDQTYELRPGDYCGPVWGYAGAKPAVFMRKPNGALCHVTSPPHTFIEEDDGTLTIAASISDKRVHGGDHSDGWHGFLERGTWREV